LPWVIENGISFFAFDLDRVRAALAAAQRVKRIAFLHLEVETGLYRTGLSEQALSEAVSLVRKHPDHLKIVGLCTHLAGAESFANYLRVTEQIRVFEARAEQLKALGHPDVLKHAACSAGAFNFPHSIFDLVRFGIAHYGYWPSSETWVAWLRNQSKGPREGSPLKRVLEWKSHVLDLTTVPFGEYVGYGNAYQAQRETQIAVVPVGYSSGFPRSQSNLGQVLIDGKLCPVVGTINMNMLSVDVTDCDPVQRGDEVVLIGNQGDCEISVASFAERTRTFNYETLVRLDGPIPRQVVD
ncbi:MAG: alanine racemase, partial [Planctomycetes bacterium]|nr:alanine racemase [Planctomycetota bacterium]